MSLEKLKDEIEANISFEVKKIRDAAAKQAAEILAKAKEDAAKLVEVIKNEALEQARLESVKISAARLQAKKILGDAQETIVAQALSILSDELKGLAGSKEYKKFLEKKLKESSRELGNNLTCLARKEDKEFISSVLKCQFKPIEPIGGAILESRDGSVSIDFTFETILKEKEDELRQKAHALLFEN